MSEPAASVEEKEIRTAVRAKSDPTKRGALMTGLIRSDEALPDAPDGYGEWLADVKRRVRATQFQVARAANTEVLRLYWSIGHDILTRRREAGWGAKVLDRASADLRAEFPGQSGFSRTNLHYMSKVAEVWPTEDDFVHHVGERLPWRHITVLVDRLASREERDWYAARAAAEGWSHDTSGDMRTRRVRNDC
ncbi:MAG: DUF1016 N-terminal domain-containing protein [Micrococcales bacterium]|nr:DUF1016 N-terminal domain-containing protein [Micrococcales bacterium]